MTALEDNHSTPNLVIWINPYLCVGYPCFLDYCVKFPPFLVLYEFLYDVICKVEGFGVGVVCVSFECDYDVGVDDAWLVEVEIITIIYIVEVDIAYWLVSETFKASFIVAYIDSVEYLVLIIIHQIIQVIP